MEKITYNLKFYFTLCLGLSLGLIFPFAFIILDLKQLELNFNFNNMFEIFKSQNIYIFSTVLFPALFGSIASLFFYISNQTKKLKIQGNYVKNVLDSINDAICVCDSSGKIEYSNKGYSNLYKNGQKSVGKILGINDLSQLIEGHIYELNLKNSDKESSFISYTVHRLLESKVSFNKDQYIVSIRDIQKLKQNEEIIMTQKEQLFEASKLSSLGEMAAGFAHEINNPLAIIHGRLKISQRAILTDEASKESTLKNIETCLKTVDRVAKIILSLKNLAHRTDSKKDDEEVTIMSLIEDPVTVANMKINGRNITFTVDVENVGDETLVCNSIQISQVLMNFIGNSIDAIEAEENSWLKLSAVVNESEVIFTITDSGPGIPMELQNKIFEPMFTTKAIGKGTGLGLSISRSVIEKHEGKIQLDTSIANTSFIITLPRKKLTKTIAA